MSLLKESANGKILTDEEAMDLFFCVSGKLNRSECDNTLKYTMQWLADKKVPDPDGIIAALQELGGYCDCELLYNCYNSFDEDDGLDYFEEDSFLDVMPVTTDYPEKPVKKDGKIVCVDCGKKMKQQFNGLNHCKCGISWVKGMGYFERSSDMVFALERRKVGKKVKQFPVIRYK